KPLIPQLLSFFADPPLELKDKNGEPRTAKSRKDVAKIEKLVELPSLQREVYQLWGIKLDLDNRKKRTATEMHDELLDLVVRGLSEQRERMLDLIDRVLAAIVEESCPENKPPEDWDWKNIREGYYDHFKVKLPPEVEDHGDAEMLVRDMFERAEALYMTREKDLGVENAMRVFRHLYLEGIDQAWQDHLSNMEHLRDGIGLRGYGQKDPKNEYKKEGYDLFLNMMAKVSSTVLLRFFEVQVQRTEDIEALEAVAAEEHQQLLEQAVARHPGSAQAPPEELLAQMMENAAAAPPPRASAPPAPKIGRNDDCPCGSGKKFKKCHGAALEDDDAPEEQPRA
ncbi:MAG TPA: SEC-C metal-binding domain-containing protein, partial [Polyangiaceae bacterium]|nr:SEC-C metal-binding domain-containing protein [Polyangiaceae bacterium]